LPADLFAKPPHPATVAQRRAALTGPAPRPATVAQRRPALAGPAPRPPHPGTVAQRRPALAGPTPRPPHSGTAAQRRPAPAPRPHPAMVFQRAAATSTDVKASASQKVPHGAAPSAAVAASAAAPPTALEQHLLAHGDASFLLIGQKEDVKKSKLNEKSDTLEKYLKRSGIRRWSMTSNLTWLNDSIHAGMQPILVTPVNDLIAQANDPSRLNTVGIELLLMDAWNLAIYEIRNAGAQGGPGIGFRKEGDPPNMALVDEITADAIAESAMPDARQFWSKWSKALAAFYKVLS
jgi:hypothetical protein